MGAGQIDIELNRESQMPALLRGSTIAIVVLTAAACREDAESPTAPLVSEPGVASATQALTFRQVSGGEAHSCGVTTDDRAYCWGANFGALGDGMTTGRLTPVAVTGGKLFRQVSAGT